MNVREQFHAIMDGAPVDGMPVLEWAYWWDKTLDGWYGEGSVSYTHLRAHET